MNKEKAIVGILTMSGSRLQFILQLVPYGIVSELKITKKIKEAAVSSPVDTLDGTVALTRIAIALSKNADFRH